MISEFGHLGQDDADRVVVLGVRRLGSALVSVPVLAVELVLIVVLVLFALVLPSVLVLVVLILTVVPVLGCVLVLPGGLLLVVLVLSGVLVLVVLVLCSVLVLVVVLGSTVVLTLLVALVAVTAELVIGIRPSLAAVLIVALAVLVGILVVLIPVLGELIEAAAISLGVSRLTSESAVLVLSAQQILVETLVVVAGSGEGALEEDSGTRRGVQFRSELRLLSGVLALELLATVLRLTTF